MMTPKENMPSAGAAPAGNARMPEGNARMPGSDAGAQQGQVDNQQVEELTKRAIGLIYGEDDGEDGKTFANLVKMLKSGAKDLPEVVSTAAVAIGDRLEKQVGQLPDQVLQEVGSGVVATLLDLSQDIGLIDKPNPEIGKQAYAKTLQKWMKSHPDRVDPAQLQQSMSQLQANAPVTPADTGLLEV